VSSEAPRTKSGLLRRLLRPVVIALAALYLLVDALFLLIVHPVAEWLARLPAFAHLGGWLRQLGPYPTLLLFLIPVIALEPIKPISAYLFATGHGLQAALVLGIGELLKITIVERLFHMSRDKLLTIPWFAWIYGIVTGWLAWACALPGWIAVMRLGRAIKLKARGVFRLLRRQL
jgi:hypothetical protein